MITCKAPVMNTEQPMSRKMTRPVSLCSLMPRKRGCSPGAALSDSSFRLFTCEMDSTVAATNHGKPITEHTASINPTINRSKWYPQPFYRGTRNIICIGALEKTKLLTECRFYVSQFCIKPSEPCHWLSLIYLFVRTSCCSLINVKEWPT